MAKAENKQSTIGLGLEAALAVFKLISPNEKNQELRNIKQKGKDIKNAFKIHRKLTRKMKKDGITPEEQIKLDDLLNVILEAEIKHLEG